MPSGIAPYGLLIPPQQISLIVTYMPSLRAAAWRRGNPFDTGLQLLPCKCDGLAVVRGVPPVP
jgi:hypothetical protein